MNQQSFYIREIRDVANRFDSDSINSCIQLAMDNKENPCYASDELENAMSILAKASFVRGQMEQGVSLALAIRELGKRIRLLQLNNE